jgi:hypothetical protein
MFREYVKALLFVYPLASASREIRLMAAARDFIRK